MLLSRLSAIAAVAAFMVVSSLASPHVVNIDNRCGGPTILQLPGRGIFYNVDAARHRLFDGDLPGGIVQACGDVNGQGCTSVEFTLVDGISSADITLIPPHRFDHPAYFKLNDNDAISATCSNPYCGNKNAFYKTDDYSAQRQVTGPNSGIYVRFC